MLLLFRILRSRNQNGTVSVLLLLKLRFSDYLSAGMSISDRNNVTFSRTITWLNSMKTWYNRFVFCRQWGNCYPLSSTWVYLHNKVQILSVINYTSNSPRIGSQRLLLPLKLNSDQLFSQRIFLHSHLVTMCFHINPLKPVEWNRIQWSWYWWTTYAIFQKC